MDQTTHEVRLANWKAIIEQCQARPKGQTAKQWMDENDISDKQYYYWLRRVRAAAIKENPIPALPEPEKQLPTVSFAEIPVKEVLSTEEFDEEVFTEQIDRITVPEHGTLVFYFKDGSAETRHWVNTSHKDCWTEQYRAKASEERRSHPRCKNATELTAKIKCSVCGCNFRRATQPSAELGKAYYWRCSEH